MNFIDFLWENSTIRIPAPPRCETVFRTPVFAVPLSDRILTREIDVSLESLKGPLANAASPVIIVEDCTRPTKTAFLIENLVRRIQELRGSAAGLKIVIAAGAHFNLSEKEMLKKTGRPEIPVFCHDAVDPTQGAQVGVSRSGIPLILNKMVVEADFRLTVSTVNIHPLAGFSGGGKILVPGAAGIETIMALHDLPSGVPGDYHSPMRFLMDEVLNLVPVHGSWQLLSTPEGAITHIFSGPVQEAHSQAIAALLPLVTVSDSGSPSDLVLAGCCPFNHNLLGTFKALPQTIPFLHPGGALVVFNEAYQGRGAHHWRNLPEVAAEQKQIYRAKFNGIRVAVYSPGCEPDDFQELFPEGFQPIQTYPDLLAFLSKSEYQKIMVLPYAPLILAHTPSPIKNV